MMLSPHFSLREMTRSATGERLGLSNVPPQRIVTNLRLTAERMEQVRRLLGNQPLTIMSAYRSPAVNRAVDGSASSDHLTGLAVDFTAAHMSPYQMALAIMDSDHRYDQCILYRSHIHLGYGPRMRRHFMDSRRG